MNWTELLAAGTILVFAVNYFSSNKAVAVRTPYARPLDDPAVQAKIAKIKPYRDYSNLVIKDGKVLGGL